MSRRTGSNLATPSNDAVGLAARVARREFLRFLAASPVWLSAAPAAAVEAVASTIGAEGAAANSPPSPALIEAAVDAINVFDFEPVAKRNIAPQHWTYLSMGIQDGFTLRRNREAFGEVQLRPRRLVDVRDLDTSTEALGTKLSCPIALCPCGSQKAFHPEGEIAVAKAARAKDHLMILSTSSSTPLAEVADARGAPIWFQLYTADVWMATKRQLAEAEAAGCPVVVLTVDQIGLARNRDALNRQHRPTQDACRSCHDSWGDTIARTARSMGFDARDLIQDLMVLDWDTVDRIRDGTSMKLVVKGILTPEDAALCVEHGVDGIVVSNHGGRAEDSGLSTIEVLPEIVTSVGGHIPILVDSGFRRGSDVFKALAFGASAVCVGRPYLWGLGAFGQAGVETVLELLRRELTTTMLEMGTPTLASITPDFVRRLPCARTEG